MVDEQGLEYSGGYDTDGNPGVECAGSFDGKGKDDAEGKED
jgi:hypothetical protein